MKGLSPEEIAPKCPARAVEVNLNRLLRWLVAHRKHLR